MNGCNFNIGIEDVHLATSWSLFSVVRIHYDARLTPRFTCLFSVQAFNFKLDPAGPRPEMNASCMTLSGYHQMGQVWVTALLTVAVRPQAYIIAVSSFASNRMVLLTAELGTAICFEGEESPCEPRRVPEQVL